MDQRPPLWDDQELADILNAEPELREVGRLVRSSQPEPVVGEHFQPYLRARLMDAAERELRPRGLRRRLRAVPTAFAWGGAAAGVAMIAAVVATFTLYQPNDRVHELAYTSAIDGRANVDPNDVIRISFSQPMDHTAVVQGLHIEPATSYTTAWQDDTLVITPQHKLAANTPYTVTVAKPAARTVGGQVAARDVRITFGTQSTPASVPSLAPSGPPQLVLHPLTPVGDAAQLVVGGDGSVVVSVTTPVPPSAAATSSTASASTSSASTSALPGVPGIRLPTPGSSGTATSTSTTAATPAQPSLSRFTADGTGTRLGDAALAAVLSPDGRSVAYLAGHGSGADLRVVGIDGSQAATLATGADAASPLAWGDGEIVFTSGGVLHAVDLQGRVRSLAAHTPIAAGQLIVLAPDGRHAFQGPAPAATPSPTPGSTPTPTPAPSTTATPGTGAGGSLVDLRTGDSRPLSGSGNGPAGFSGDGSVVAWVDTAQASPRLASQKTDGGDTSTIPVPQAAAGDTITDLVLDGDGARAAYVLHHPSASELRVVALPSGDVVAGVATQAIRPAISPAGDLVAAVVTTAGGTLAETARVPGPASTPTPSASPQPSPSSAPRLDTDGATRVLSGLLLVQTGASGAPDPSTLLAPSSAFDLTALTPSHITRGYIVGIAPAAGSQTAVNADVRLIRDPSKTEPTQFADESVTLDRSAADQSYRITALTVTPLRQEQAGPQVVHVQTTSDKPRTVVRISFDSDLRADSVAGAVTIRDAQGTKLDADVAYDAEHRTIVVTVASGKPSVLEIGQTLRDVDAQPLSAPYRTSLAAD